MTSTLSGPWRLLRRRPDLARLVSAGLVSLTGDWLLIVGLAYAVYDLTGSTMASAGVVLVSLVPQVLVGLVAGVLVDRWDRRRTMIVANLLLAVVLLPLLLVDGADRIWVVYPVLVFHAVVETFFAPAEQAMLPRVVDESDSAELVTANALNGQARNLSRLTGGALGGVAAAIGGLPAVAFADAMTFWSPRAAGRHPYVGRGGAARREPRGLVRGRFAELRDDWIEGAKVALGSPTIRVLATFWLITSFGEGIWGTLFAPYVRSVLESGPRGAGGDQRGAGRGRHRGRLGRRDVRRPLVTAADAGRRCGDLRGCRPRDRALSAGWVSAWPAGVLMVVVGLPGAIVTAGMMTLFQQHSNDRERGRVFALLLLVRALATVLGSLTAGLLGDRIGIIPVMAWQGAGYMLAGSIVLVMLVRAPEPAPART